MESFTIAASANSVFDAEGNAVNTALSLATSLNEVQSVSISSRAPTAGEAGISIAATVDVTFDIAMSISSFTSSTFSLSESGGSSIAGSVSFDISTTTASFSLGTSLAYQRTYTATLNGVAGSNNTTLALTSWSFSSVDLTSDLVLYLPLNSNGDDFSGNGYHGTVSGSIATTDRLSTVDGAFNFDGTDDIITVTNHADLDIGQDASRRFSLAFWYKAEGTATTAQGLVTKRNGTSSANDDYSVLTGSGNLAVQTGSGDNTVFIAEPTRNTWHHVAFTLEANGTTTGVLKLYVDGELASKSSYTAKTAVQTADLKIGFLQGGAYFDGKIDEIRVYHRTLTSDEVKALADPDNNWNGALWGTAAWGD
ncbi:MAG: Ig-like domain-containing protein [SAR324 cluster bacterium]|nr:Ig-like domain-containing protein [SAR324 cluster bacterium]